ncbi:phosphoglycerate mutase-like protein [Tothia fuscella]|uniref:Phosphoglycerate mutase-like protein n=1 Tax=Tothia fuscella TaxID=1048955 RepID=A0A9P4U1P9_9PEZI|nr:phosphoglycerate mutase-like protein [Tothia fuscella]
MRLFLIRHGETVDNVAQIYAGSRDSELTNHGFQQATRLGQHLHVTGVELTHVFSSHLKRAVKTAELVRDPQIFASAGTKRKRELEVKQVPLLVEQDFGSLEGVSYVPRPLGSNRTGKSSHRELHIGDPGFVDQESKESMIARANAFIDEHFVALLEQSEEMCNVAIVSHGIFLGVLWRTLLGRLPEKSVTYHPELLATHGNLDLARLGGGSNTGYLELELCRRSPSQVFPAVPSLVSLVDSPLPIESGSSSTAVGVDVVETGAPTTDEPPVSLVSSVTETPQPDPAPPKPFATWTTTIHGVNSKKHLVGLKRTGGGVGSSRHDTKQKSIDTFFKRRKAE